MYTFVLQDWVTLKIDKNITTVTQGANGWLALPEFQDVIFWMEFRAVSKGGALSDPQLIYETAPLPEESLFLTTKTATTFSANVFGASSTDSVLLNHNPTVPLAQWLRWKVKATGTPSSSWGATFRIRVAANATSKYYLRR